MGPTNEAEFLVLKAIADQAGAQLAALQQIIDAANAGTLTNIQLTQAAKTLAQGQRRLIRYVVGILDAPS